MNFEIKIATPDYYKETEILTREAFWDLYKPGCDEHLIVHKIRNVQSFVPELDFIAVAGNKVIGNIIYSKAKVIDENDREHEVLCMGPLCVLPSCQKMGAGSGLMRHSINKAKELGYKGVVIFGNPDYYHRFGFKNAVNYGIKTSDGQNFDAFMALELYDGSLSGISGKFYYDSIFAVDKNELEEFEKKFPYKEKHVTDTQFKEQ